MERAGMGSLALLWEEVPLTGCAFDGCSRPHYAKSFCRLHYKRWLRNGHAELLPRMRVTILTRICACGCGESFTPKLLRHTRPQRYIKGHWRRNRSMKSHVTELTPHRRKEIYSQAGDKCERCGISMEDHIERYGRRMDIHHKNDVHADNFKGNHEVLCRACHNRITVQSRDEVKKSETWRRHYQEGKFLHWFLGQTKETHSGLAAMSRKKQRNEPKAKW